MSIRQSVSERGLVVGEFLDSYGERCTIQDSSSAELEAIWLGRDGNRMHLERSQVQELLPLLNHFVAFGELPKPTE